MSEIDRQRLVRSSLESIRQSSKWLIENGTAAEVAEIEKTVAAIAARAKDDRKKRIGQLRDAIAIIRRNLLSQYNAQLTENFAISEWHQIYCEIAGKDGQKLYQECLTPAMMDNIDDEAPTEADRLAVQREEAGN